MLVGAPFPMEPVIGFGWIALFLIVGMWLRAKVPLFRRYLIPACLLGGTIGFLANTFGLLNATGLGVSSKTLSSIAYHLFNLTWILLGLQKSAQKRTTGGIAAMKGPLWLAGIQLTTISLCYGGVILMGIMLVGLGYNQPASLGLLVATGFSAGPGQAMTRAAIWEHQAGMTGLVAFALAGASTGYLISMILGIPLVNILCRRQKRTTFTSSSLAEQRGYYGPGEGPSAGSQTTVTNSIETLSWHLGIAIVIYLIILGFFVLAGKVLPPKIMAMVWGLFFAVALGAGMLARKALGLLGLDHLCCHNMTNRVSGFMVDFLVCATFITIQVGAVERFLTHYIASCILATVVITTALWLYCKNVKENGVESFGMVFGTLTGTISTGLLLMRIVDPDCESPVARNYGIASLFLYPYFLLLAVVVHWEVVLHRSPWTIVGVFAACAIIGLALARWARPSKFAANPLGAQQVSSSTEGS